MIVQTAQIQLPPAFSGPAQLILYTRYGDPRKPGWENRWITTWPVQLMHPWFPKEELRVHKHFWPMLHDAFNELELYGLYREIKTADCCYQLGHLYDSPVLSVHSWGAAIDFNGEQNPFGSMGKWSDAFIEVMTRNGVCCGQLWTGVKQPKHFSMVEG